MPPAPTFSLYRRPPCWISKVGHAYTCPTSSSAWALFKPRDAEPTKAWPLSSRGPQPGDEARPKTGRHRATPKVPGWRLPQVTQPGGGLLGRLPGGGGPGLARGGEGRDAGWRRWCLESGERACEAPGGARHRGLSGQVHSPVPLRPPLAPSAPRPPGGPPSRSAEVGSRKGRSCGGASAPVASTAADTAASTPGAPPASRGRLLAARLPLSQPYKAQQQQRASFTCRQRLPGSQSSCLSLPPLT
ncbi:collagen alpha-1(I) chain-like [Phoca vitulina]|uniref:collagen alpha-1(I) chain-like n=1 Tax=Phoca vitulina TaxID=9720 RepID=UPI0013963391|nr:collagen alpha-1(I) chain-like [Phoca vitulina]